MFFSEQKNKCCSLDFHQDHNIYYRADFMLWGDMIGRENKWYANLVLFYL